MDLLNYPEALQVVLGAVRSVGTETLGVRDALGRVLAKDLTVSRDYPDLPRSAVDGYAVQADRGPDYTVVMEIPAGRLPPRALRPGEAAAVMTGGVIPGGADCMVMVEDCRRRGDALTTPPALTAGDKINAPGDEARRGDALASAGRRIGAAMFPALFCAGLTQVPVFRRPRVGVLVTGGELREVEDGPAPGQVFNTNRYIIEGVCTGLGIPHEPARSVEDDPREVARAMDDLCSRCDVVITSGGVSAGVYDFMRATLDGGDYELLVAGTRIKPGRPLHVARRGKALIFAMPGYPAALLINALLYLVPALKKACGRIDHRTRWLAARTADPLRGRPGRQYMARVDLRREDGGWVARDPGSQMSSHFLNFAGVNGLARLPLAPPPGATAGSGAFTLPAGAAVDVLHLDLELT